MITKHTPGPWFTDSGSPDVVRVRIDGGGQRMIADAGFGQDDEVADANARLIAAAPNLLEALRRCLDAGIGADGRLPSASEQARAAIARATGEQP